MLCYARWLIDPRTSKITTWLDSVVLCTMLFTALVTPFEA
jgi:hypothetical protein